LIFVYPFIQKEIHTLEHTHDFQCTTHTEQHYHAEQHHCLVCEYTILLGEIANEFSVNSQPATYSVYITSCFIESNFNTQAYSYLLRGPPVF
jgi:hypothetical protein